MRERGGLAVHGGSEVADEVRHRRHEPAVADRARAFAVHPGAGALAFAGIEICVEISDFLPVAPNLEELDVGMPERSLCRHDSMPKSVSTSLKSPANTVGSVK